MKVNLRMATELDGIVKGMRIDCDFLVKQASKQGHRGGNVEKDYLVILYQLQGLLSHSSLFLVGFLTTV